MGLSKFDPAARERVSWNARGKVGAKRALKPRQIWAIRFFLDQHGRTRDRALFDLAIDNKLRGCDLVKIKISDRLRPKDSDTGDRRPAKNRAARSVRADGRRSREPAPLVGSEGRPPGRLCLPEPHRSCHPHEHPPVCPLGG